MHVSRAQKISTVVDKIVVQDVKEVSRAQKISTVVDLTSLTAMRVVSRAQKISTVVDALWQSSNFAFHALKKFLLL